MISDPNSSINTEMNKNQVLEKTINYVRKFNRYGSGIDSNQIASKAKEINRIIPIKEQNEQNNQNEIGESKIYFTNVEHAQIVDILPQSVDEAYSLIPSLRR